MTNRAKIGLIGAVILLIGLMFFIIKPGGGNKVKKSTYFSSNWTNQYGLLDKKPYGLYLFSTLTKAHIDSTKKVIIAHNIALYDSLMHTNKNRTYVFTGKRFGMYSSEFDDLLEKVEEGSDLFLAYESITNNMEKKMFASLEMTFDYSQKVTVKSKKDTYQLIHLYQGDTIARDWKAFNRFDAYGNFRSLSSFQDVDNLIEIEYGEGKIILCSTPNAFYNFQVKRKDGFHYAQFVLNQLPKNQDIVFLEFGRLSEDYDNYEEEQNENEDDSYLRLLFSNSALLKAMLFSLLALFLYAVFRSKRIRPIVPYLGKKKNMTVAFAETITSIYFSKRDPYTLLQVQRKNFFAMVQKHFYLDLNRGDRSNVLRSLAEKSNHDIRDLEEFITMLETKSVAIVNEQYLANVLALQHDFYRKTGIVSDKMKERTQKLEQIFRRSLFLPWVFILIGIIVIITGLYFLMNSYGVGIALWPIGIILIILGIIRISNPYLVVKNKKWTVFSPFGKKQEFKEEEIKEVEILTSGVLIHLQKQHKIIINYWELSSFDKEYFKQFISQIHTETQ